jgi:hypothetical protein
MNSDRHKATLHITASMDFLDTLSSGDSVLAILIGLLGAFLLHVASKLMESSVPFHVRTSLHVLYPCRHRSHLRSISYSGTTFAKQSTNV